MLKAARLRSTELNTIRDDLDLYSGASFGEVRCSRVPAASCTSQAP